ncbi:MAG: prolyl oligopeptidase family serine peptidase [Bacteroidia bacterium]|nr:prolyl oligopeptidase family serine peptidase [Bacteroidia bacterium]
MRKLKKISYLIFLFLIASKKEAQNKWQYPETIRQNITDDYFGVKVPDPYRWLEDENSSWTKDWIERQNQFTEIYFRKYIPEREKLEKELEACMSYSSMGMPVKNGKYYVTWVSRPEWNQPVLYYSEKLNFNLSQGWKEALDVNKMSDKGLYSPVAFALHSKKDWMAYALSYSGSDWNTIYVKDLKTGKFISDSIPYSQFSGLSWWKDKLVYTVAEKPELSKMYSKPVSSYSVFCRDILKKTDSLVYSVRDSLRIFLSGWVSEDQRFMFLSLSKGTSGNQLKIKKLKNANKDWYDVTDRFQFNYDYVGNSGDTVFIKTNENSPNNKVIALWFKENDVIPLGEVVSHHDKRVIQQFVPSPLGYFYSYLENVQSYCAFRKNNENEWNKITLEQNLSVRGIYYDKNEKKFYLSVQSFFNPNRILEYNPNGNKVAQKYEVNAGIKPEDYISRQIFFPARDGTKIPMFILSSKSWDMKSPVPAFVYGYGGFNISLTPSFSGERLPFLKRGGIYVIVNLRGGGEFGEDWHAAGTKCQKQNVFNDFMDAIDYLVKQNWTSYDKVAIHGRSNGGLLIGAVITQRPDICRVALPAVGVLDMLRYQHFTVGRGWAVDYGLSENKEEFNCLLKYSPYHNAIRAERNPATLVITADHDDRVVPSHSFKFASALQYHSISDYPVLIRIEKSAGHGAGKPKKQLYKDASYLWGMVFYHLNMPF